MAVTNPRLKIKCKQSGSDGSSMDRTKPTAEVDYLDRSWYNVKLCTGRRRYRQRERDGVGGGGGRQTDRKREKKNKCGSFYGKVIFFTDVSFNSLPHAASGNIGHTNGSSLMSKVNLKLKCDGEEIPKLKLNLHKMSLQILATI